MIRWFKRFMAVASLAVLASCGGGGGDAGSCTFDCPGEEETEVADLVITLSSVSITNAGGDTVTATVTALDDNRSAVEGATVLMSVDANAIATVSGTTTGTEGTVSASVGIGADKSNRTVTITATSGSLTRQATFQVTGTRITSTYASTVTPGSTNTIRYLVTDINAIPLVDQEITVAGSGLPSATGTTSEAGYFDYTYDAPSAAGSLEITATAAGVSDVATVQVQATGGVDDAVGPVSSASVSASPNKVSTNTDGSTANQSQIRALFVRADNSPIQNVRVRFDLAGDANSVGGTLSSGNSMLYSSSAGTVTVSYVPGSRSSPTDGVTIRACWDYTDFAAGACPNAVTTKLTVTSEAISVTLGTNGLIEEGQDELTYIKKFVVLVVDSAGNAMPGVTISPVVDIVRYRKGEYTVALGGWSQGVAATCDNEDDNRNGVLDSGEDVNSNGTLEPRKADVSIRMVDSTTTDASGLAILQIEYPQNVGSWDFVTITVSASGVSGTEGSASYSTWLPVLADHVNDTDSSPAFQLSPYGFGACTDPD
jgi:hypothetical protein